MRLQLIAAAAAALVVASHAPAARAQWSVDGQVAVYADDDATSVVTPRTRVAWSPDGEAEVAVRYGLDIITSASVDVVASATRGFEEERHELAVSARHPAGELVLAGTAALSREPDFESRSLLLSVTQRLEDRRTEIEVGLRAGAAEVGVAGTPLSELGRRLDTLGGGLTVRRAMSPTLRAELGYVGERREGYQSSPYRWVDLADGLRAPEVVPGVRDGHAVAATLAWSLGPTVALHGVARGYGDDWGQRSLSGEALLRRAAASGGFEGAVRLRGLGRTAADLYAASYPTTARWMTADRRLAPMWSALAGAEVGWRTGPHLGTPVLRLTARVDVWRMRWSDHPRQEGRDAVLLSLGGGGRF